MIREIPFKFNDGSFQKKTIFGIVLILLCGLSFMILSSELIFYTDDYYGQVRLSDMINRVNDEYDVLEQLDGVSLKTEFDVYSPDTTRILAYWENNSEINIAFGEPWRLFKKRGNEFVPVIRTSGGNYGWIMPAYGIRPGKTVKHIYSIKPFTDKLTPGIYQIKTDFRDDEAKIYYVLEAEFEVSNDKSKWGKSALDFLNGEKAGKFRDITMGGHGYGREAYGNIDFRLYKNDETYDTIITDGTYEYDIGKGFGKWGVVREQTYEADGKIYLVYSYSREIDGKHCSYLCVLDVTDNTDVKEVYKSEPFFSDYDVVFVIYDKLEKREDGQLYAVLDENGDFVMDNKFFIFHEKFKEYEGGGYDSESVLNGHIGFLVYENGGFFYEENTDLQ